MIGCTQFTKAKPIQFAFKYAVYFNNYDIYYEPKQTDCEMDISIRL